MPIDCFSEMNCLLHDLVANKSASTSQDYFHHQLWLTALPRNVLSENCFARTGQRLLSCHFFISFQKSTSCSNFGSSLAHDFARFLPPTCLSFYESTLPTYMVYGERGQNHSDFRRRWIHSCLLSLPVFWLAVLDQEVKYLISAPMNFARFLGNLFDPSTQWQAYFYQTFD